MRVVPLLGSTFVTKHEGRHDIIRRIAEDEKTQTKTAIKHVQKSTQLASKQLKQASISRDSVLSVSSHEDAIRGMRTT